MKAQVLHIDDCPNTAEATLRLRCAMDAVGLEHVAVEEVPVRTDIEAASTAFAGSPTFLLDGVDLLPATATSSLACRVYPTETGMSGTPTQAQLEQALLDRLS